MSIIKVLFFLFCSHIIFGQINKRRANFNLENNIAVQGFDVVAYFTLNNPTKGYAKFQVEYQGIIYYFNNINNKETFSKNPKKYEPQYGGWCAYALGAKNEKVDIDPEVFKIIDGKLYLFYRSFINNTLEKWNKNEAIYKSKADLNWLNLNK